MWDFINKIIYINLEHREDRRKIMEKFFDDTKIPLDKVVRFSAIKRSHGELGALESHTEILKLAKENCWKNILILEDDLEIFHFEEGYKQLEDLVKLSKWDVIMLAGWYHKYEFPRVFEAYNAGAYLIHSDYIETLLKNREYSVSKLSNGIGFNAKNRTPVNHWCRDIISHFKQDYVRFGGKL
jgi:glycosyl transferase family 25